MKATMEKKWTDETILNAIRAGGDARLKALEFLYKNPSYNQEVKKYLAIKGCKPEDVEDIIHNAFIILDRKIRDDEFKEGHPIQYFFKKTCEFLWLNLYRKNKKHGYSLTDEEVLSIHNFESRFIAVDLWEHLSKVLDRIGPKCKKLIVLDALGYSRKEIAVQMGFKNGDPRLAINKLSRCKKKLSNLIIKKYEVLKDLLEFLK